MGFPARDSSSTPRDIPSGVTGKVRYVKQKRDSGTRGTPVDAEGVHEARDAARGQSAVCQVDHLEEVLCASDRGAERRRDRRVEHGFGEVHHDELRGTQ